MRNLWLGAVAAPLLAVGLAFGGKPAKTAKDEATCGSHGTAIDFVDTPNDAAKKAKKEEKLVLVLHVSGNFEDPRFT
ncbi:MAG: hypothetical protein K2W96_27910 [Gemmataceae bacterium]|nr:hypothetical protein [Gemmataceae bacterium]